MNTRCAACKKLRRRCSKDCVLAPYFPPYNPQRFEYVHEIFGASNITKMLEQLPINLRGEAAECMCFEAKARVKDPIYGCVSFISHLQQEVIQLQNELLNIKRELALHKNAHQNEQMLAQTYQQAPTTISNDHGHPFWIDFRSQEIQDLDRRLFH